MELQSIKQRFGIIGNSPALNHALEIAIRVATTDLTVLITGESGVGKEFFPQIIHAFSTRKHGSYIAVNCGAIPEGTIDSELFGHEKGSFTGASEARKGYFEVADGGTIFLDEVAELPLTTQVRLLRILQTGEFMRVGSSKVERTNVRVVAATNVNLIEAVSKGRFREDLYYRLNTVPVFVPPLRERKGDIYTLFRKFASDIANQYRMPIISLTPDARAILENYEWRGNIRQLKNAAEQISAIEESRDITGAILVKYLPDYTVPSTALAYPQESSSSGGIERDLLYKILFDMSADIIDLKRMVAELRGNSGIVTPAPAAYPYPIATPPTALPPHEDPIFHSAEVVSADEDAMTKEKHERESIIKALKRHSGRRKDAAKDLFISERTLYRKIKDYGIDE